MFHLYVRRNSYVKVVRIQGPLFNGIGGSHPGHTQAIPGA